MGRILRLKFLPEWRRIWGLLLIYWWELWWKQDEEILGEPSETNFGALFGQDLGFSVSSELWLYKSLASCCSDSQEEGPSSIRRSSTRRWSSDLKVPSENHLLSKLVKYETYWLCQSWPKSQHIRIEIVAKLIKINIQFNFPLSKCQVLVLLTNIRKLRTIHLYQYYLF